MPYRHARRKPKHHHNHSNIFRICVGIIVMIIIVWFGAALREAVTEISAEIPNDPTEISDSAFRPQVGDPPYRVVVDAGHGGKDPGARGVIEEKTMTAATAEALMNWLEVDANYVPLRTRENYETGATPAERAAAANVQEPQLLISIHGNSAAAGSDAAGFECYPASGMQGAGAHLRGHGGIRYLYYLENDQKQLMESTHNEVRAERSFTILEDVNCPAVLVEQCFVTNENDVAAFGTEEGCRKAARVYYEAICQYFGTEPLTE